MRARGLGLAVVWLTVLSALPGCFVSRLENLGVRDEAAREELARLTIVLVKDNDLYLARGDGTGAVKMISSAEVGHAAACFMPAIDAGGRRILFLSIVDLEVRDSTGRDLALNILTLDAPLAPGVGISSWRRIRLEKIAPPGADGRQEIFTVAGAAWSRDGRRVALGLNRAATAGGDAVVLLDEEGRPLSEYDMPGSDLARVSAISWTNDGRSIILGLAGASDSEGMVARLDLPSVDPPRGAPTIVALAPGRYPSLAPDGMRIATVVNRSGQSDIVLLGLDGKETARFERPAGRAPSTPFWSTSGRYLYYYSLGATGPLGLIDVNILRCLDTRTRQVFDLMRVS